MNMNYLTRGFYFSYMTDIIQLYYSHFLTELCLMYAITCRFVSSI